MMRGTTIAALVLQAAIAGAGVEIPAHPAVEGAPQHDDEASHRLVEYRDDRLSVHLQKVPLDDVLSELARISGAQIRGELRDPHEVTAEFRDVPLSDALHRLLGNQNFALVYGRSGELRAVRLLGGPQTAAPKSPAVASLLPTTTTLPPSPGNLLALFARHAPLPVSGRLAEAFGSNTATFEQLLNASLHNDDPAVRAEGLRVFIGGVEGDAELKNAVLGSLGTMDDQQLTALVQSIAGDHASEFVAGVVTRTRDGSLRTRGSIILERLHNGG
jgi:hypothetical protein